MEQNLEKYAELILKKGINIVSGEPLLILAPIESIDFVRRLVRHANQMGVTDIDYILIDHELVKSQLLALTPEEIRNCALFDRSKMDICAKKGGSVICLKGADPDGMDGVPTDKMVASQKRMLETEAYAREKRKTYEMPWTIVAVATEKWAQKVFPDIDNPVEKLWDVIFKCTLVDQDDPLAAWDEKSEKSMARYQKMNALHLRTLHYTNALGTDLTVTLPEGYRFTGAKEYSPTHKRELLVNIPTEEIFCSPHYLGTSGIVYSTKPLVHQGTVIENFYFRFEKGKVVEYDAEKGREALESIFEVDENAKYLGEVALVDYDSPISNSKILFYTTLFDENASCHLALGSGFPTTIEGGTTMDIDQLQEAGVNHSDAHVDFMIGSEDLTIVGTDEEGREHLIFKDGNFALL